MSHFIEIARTAAEIW